MLRYFVCRQSVKFKGQVYYEGELLPETFTHHDYHRHIYSSRIGRKEVPLSSQVKPSGEQSPDVDALKGNVPADTQTSSTPPGTTPPAVSKPTTVSTPTTQVVKNS